MMIRTALLGLSTATPSGCFTRPPLRVSVPVPVECRAGEPERPTIHTKLPHVGMDVDSWVAAAQAELLQRDGYKAKLRAPLSERLGDHPK